MWKSTSSGGFNFDCRKSIAEEIEPTVESTITEEEVADHVQRLNLYFENENVRNLKNTLNVPFSNCLYISPTA